MTRPNLQVALDHSDLPSAIKAIKTVGDIVDIIEVGTILILQAGDQAVRCIRAMYPDKTIVADTKCADAGGTVAENVQKAGADWTTVICCATIPTMKAAAEKIAAVQVELYGDWTYAQAQLWLDAGIRQVIYHQSRDALLAGETWGEKDLAKIQKLIDMGFQVSVTGGLDVDTLKLFKGMAVYTFITGRGITAAQDPAQAATAFLDEIKAIWEA
ncbi:3-keto-L-gulonate-6-phosphate decarboxylase UlaD [Pseudolactococcus paracarnosus]|uniref:3-hexulose-6-phosphate synthase n=1 Tax=Pseudolactococcus paracarnosus TaxID=2749962 RepID=A0A7L4WCP8_9LACT|nr:3-keto-L-gulonate-6-phosphate decarboxylase UlaD [Lactococcus paracarnosus]SPC37826.1 3-keto-L-gulonate 6-phosphate decarboxylase [Lactococcus piscium]MCJ1977372.1 3-keto-L-gulonate-6-phosphate decarboxylase UlaD [Lactococcus paracarnosus]MCJ1983500.1 3-keto-L-gulonate-6-phosphate decarboxylase UlaD [Lactococcus paracarnosus]MCJ1993046.1 3-keto-L-gulonate-6-phosphate decarboxylase UlaD [Lactococcus paracarnosus]MCJ1997862.1 3-keto-L-gulonate-6-phosphate decarboxylase UlaD [Lactococcus parac